MAMSVMNASTWVDGCPIGPSGLLTSIGVACDYMDICGWVIRVFVCLGCLLQQW
jgi:hypothetical protein